ncbi:MAG: ABC transporter permease subunit [Turicibacter sp.]|nr:ABC transporter permease subunit [Turicibacter sp.]
MQQSQKKKPSYWSKDFKKELPFYLMLIPAFVLVLVYSYGPMVGIAMAFQDFRLADGIFGSNFNGLDNFRTLFSMPNFWPVIRNTLIIALGKMIGGIIVPVGFALLLNEIRHMGFKKSIQTMVYLPNFLSWVILASIFIDILSPSDGVVNHMLGMIGIEPIFFLGDTTWFPITMIFTEIWRMFGFGAIIYLAALTGIDPTLYEAAQIDGANRIKQTLHITFPGILSTVILMTVLSMSGVLDGGFDQIFNMYNPAVMETGDILDTLIFRFGFQGTPQWALSTAANLFRSVVSTIFVVTSYILADRLVGYRIF